MLRTFNCGIGMVMIVPAAGAETVSSLAEQEGLVCFDIGSVVSTGDDSRVRYL